jgi:beta-phosphoglucomutase-like phosphatase (HAD superfamily)
MVEYVESPVPAFLFDLDGTLIDSVYQHVIAWRAALAEIGIDLSVWRIHRQIGTFAQVAGLPLILVPNPGAYGR